MSSVLAPSGSFDWHSIGSASVLPFQAFVTPVLTLRKLFNSDTVKLPTRLGFTIKPDLKSLVLVWKGVRISRPKAKIDALEAIIKNDQVFKYIDRSIDQNHNPLLMAKIIGQDRAQSETFVRYRVDHATQYGRPTD